MMEYTTLYTDCRLNTLLIQLLVSVVSALHSLSIAYYVYFIKTTKLIWLKASNNVNRLNKLAKGKQW